MHAKRHPALTTLLPVVALLLLYGLSRAHDLLALPLFIDESVNIERAREVWRLRVLVGADTGKLLNSWWLAGFWPFAASGWVARAGTLLFGMLGVCGAYAAARSLFAPAAGLVAAAGYVLSPFLFFFDRLALPEPVAVACSALAMGAGARSARSGRARDALLCGVFLAAALAAKASMLPFLVIPLLAGALGSGRASARARLVAWAYAGFAAVWLPLWALLTVKGYHYFGMVGIYGDAPSVSLGARTVDNLIAVIEELLAYYPPLILLVAALCAVYLLAARTRAALYVLAIMAVSALAMAIVADTLFGRYALNLAPPLVVLLGGGLPLGGEALQRRAAPARPAWRWALPGAALGVWAALLALPFLGTAYTHPQDLPLSAGDRWEYVEGPSSGYGRREAARYLAAMAATQGATVHAVGLVSGCSGVALMLPDGADVEVACPRIAWGGERQGEIEARVGELAAAHAPLYVLEEGLPYVDLAGLPVVMTPVARFPRPGDMSAVILHQAMPR